jgi:FkbH-like protein
MVEIANELNIGLDALVFFDDNPVERAEVRHTAPGVHVVEVPTDPSRYVEALAATVALDTPTVTTEDRERAEYYQGQAARREAERSVTPEQFLASLQMRIAIGELDPSTSQRIAQLVGKTNQFNLTTKRYSQGELEALAAGPGSSVRWLRLADRYGDMGLICVAVLRFDGDVADIDSLVLSCRAANRGIERTMVAHLARLAGDRGCAKLVGHYARTAKNSVVENLYDDLGFVRTHEDTETRHYAHEITDETIQAPEYIELALEPTS